MKSSISRVEQRSAVAAVTTVQRSTAAIAERKSATTATPPATTVGQGLKAKDEYDQQQYSRYLNTTALAATKE